MAEMKKTELSAVLDSMIQDSVSYNSEFMKENEEYLRRYNQESYGDEEEGFSSVIASDVRDTVDSDMTSMVRVFLGSGDVIMCKPLSDDPAEVEEAKQKTAALNQLILRSPDSYRVIHGFLKDAEIQKMGVVNYYIDEVMKTDEKKFKGVSLEQITIIVDELKELDGVERVDIVDKESAGEDLFDVRVRATGKVKKFKIQNIKTESFLLTRGSSCKDEADLVGHEDYPTRGELVRGGMDEDEVAKFPTSNGSTSVTGTGQQNSGTGSSQSNAMQEIRWRDEGGDITDVGAFKEWSGEKVHRVFAYALVDYDGDGIAERRRIVKIGNKITENEPYDHIPYAVTSCILEPHKAIGNGRASLVVQDQSINTELERAMLDNIYDVGNQRDVVGAGVELDDYYDSRRDGVVRMKADAEQSPRDSIYTIPTTYIGGEIMQVKQSRDQSKASRTGTMLDSQGLEADQLHQETATRFTGIEKAQEAKIELVARNHAETGFRELFDGAEWTLRRFMDEPVRVATDSGQSFSVTPTDWEFDTISVSRVGLGAGAGDKATQQLSGILSIQKQMQDTGSLLVDNQKIFNATDQLVQSMGFPSATEFFNNPDIPQDVLLAQYEQLVQAMEMTQAQMQQMEQEAQFSQAARIEAEGKLALGREKNRLDAQKFMASQQAQAAKMMQDKEFHDSDKTYDYTKLEVENNVDIPNEGM